MWRAPHKRRVSYCRTLPLHILASTTPGSSTSSTRRSCQGSICRFLQSMYVKSTTDVASGVRQGCPASGFLFTVAFDPIFRWVHDSIIPRNPAVPDFLQHSPCAHADDFAMASSFRSLMAALSPAFVVVDRVAGLNLDHRKYCGVQYGSDSCHELLDWVSTKR